MLDRYLFYLVGPPAVGKTSIARYCCAQLRNCRHLAIDETRGESRTQTEAWNKLLLTIPEGIVLLECSALSPQLSEALRLYPGTIIKLTGRLPILRERLLARQFLLRTPDNIVEVELSLLEPEVRALDNLPGEYYRDTTGELSFRDYAKQVIDIILREVWTQQNLASK